MTPKILKPPDNGKFGKKLLIISYVKSLRNRKHYAAGKQYIVKRQKTFLWIKQIPIAI